MTRNTRRRVEVACPIYDPALRERLREMMEILKKDNVQATRMLSDGEYVSKRKKGETPLSSQVYFMNEAKRLQPKPKPKKKGLLASVGSRLFRRKQKR